jgi:hypothetical protein
LLVFARRWLYDRQLLVLRERALGSMIASAIVLYETTLAKHLSTAIDAAVLDHWAKALGRAARIRANLAKLAVGSAGQAD